MTWIKLCGLVTVDDVHAAASAGADAIGVVLAEASPRRVSRDVARDLVAESRLPVYLVTTDMPAEELIRAVGDTGAFGIQPHGSDAVRASKAAVAAGYAVLFPISVIAGADLTAAPQGTTPILDTSRPGTGREIDAELLENAPERFVLAGGLTPDNVRHKVETWAPYGVDVSSGIESAPGIKDHGRMHDFVSALR